MQPRQLRRAAPRSARRRCVAAASKSMPAASRRARRDRAARSRSARLALPPQLDIGALVATVGDARVQQVRQAELQFIEPGLQLVQVPFLFARAALPRLSDCAMRGAMSWPDALACRPASRACCGRCAASRLPPARACALLRAPGVPRHRARRRAARDWRPPRWFHFAAVLDRASKFLNLRQTLRPAITPSQVASRHRITLQCHVDDRPRRIAVRKQMPAFERKARKRGEPAEHPDQPERAPLGPDG